MRKVLLALLVIGLAGMATLYVMARGEWTAPGPLAESTEVVIARGATQRDAAATLAAAGVLEDAQRFNILARLFGSDDPIRAGEFRFAARSSPAQVLDILQHAAPVQRAITIPEGLPSVLVHERLMSEPLLTGDVAVPAEGSVLPSTYNFERGEPRASVLQRMQTEMNRTLGELWAERSERTVVQTPEEAVILASIVEKETAKPSERRMIAGVYSNRLRIGMKLDADPTVIYPITKGRPLGRRILRSELNDVNDYNTYAMAGLPKGPIANPGRASIEAVLDPAETDAIYFVADGTGGHVFSSTLAEHNANVSKWFAIRRERGEMN